MQYVEFQIRPENPDHLWYAFNVLDWPSEELGQMQERDEQGVTFYDLCANGLTAGQSPADNCTQRDDNGDVKLIPMLEIQIPANSQTLPETARAARLRHQRAAAQPQQRSGRLRPAPVDHRSGGRPPRRLLRQNALPAHQQRLELPTKSGWSGRFRRW